MNARMHAYDTAKNGVVDQESVGLQTRQRVPFLNNGKDRKTRHSGKSTPCGCSMNQHRGNAAHRSPPFPVRDARYCAPGQRLQETTPAQNTITRDCSRLQTHGHARRRQLRDSTNSNTSPSPTASYRGEVGAGCRINNNSSVCSSTGPPVHTPVRHSQ